MALSNLTNAPLRRPGPKKLEYGQASMLGSMFVKPVKKESWREYLFSNLAMSTAVSTTFLAAAALFAFASGAALPVAPLITAFFVTPLVLSAVAPVVNRTLSGTGTSSDPRNYVKRLHEDDKLEKVKDIPEEVSTSYFRRPSVGAMIGGAVLGVAVGAAAFASPLAPIAAVAVMFGTGFLSSAIAGMASAVIPSTVERLSYERDLRDRETKEANTPADSVEKQLIKAQLSEIKNQADQSKWATEALKKDFNNGNGRLSNENIKSILERRNPETSKSFVERVLNERTLDQKGAASELIK